MGWSCKEAGSTPDPATEKFPLAWSIRERRGAKRSKKKVLVWNIGIVNVKAPTALSSCWTRRDIQSPHSGKFVKSCTAQRGYITEWTESKRRAESIHRATDPTQDDAFLKALLEADGTRGKNHWNNWQRLETEEYTGPKLPICLILTVSTEMNYFQKFNIFQDFEISPIDNDLRVFHKIVEKCRHLGMMFHIGLS